MLSFKRGEGGLGLMRTQTLLCGGGGLLADKLRLYEGTQSIHNILEDLSGVRLHVITRAKVPVKRYQNIIFNTTFIALNLYQ